MIIIGIILCLMTITMLVMIARAIFNYQLAKISNKQSEKSRDFQEKLRIYQYKELKKDNKLLLGSSMVFIVCLSMLLTQHVRLLNSQIALENEFSEVRELAEKTSDQQVNIIKQVGYQEYPLAGLQLDALEWDKKDSESAKVLQLALAEKIMPYFGYKSPVIDYKESSKELSVGINLKDDGKDGQQIEKNIKSLLYDLKYTPLLKVEVKTLLEGSIIVKNYERADNKDEWEVK